MKKAVIILFAVSAAIYGLQLILFQDHSTTAFYILQDIAFLPISIAVATLVVGQVLSEKEKRERKSKTQMLTSNFFTEMGAELMFVLLSTSEENADLKNLFRDTVITDQEAVEKLQSQIRQTHARVSLNEEIYERVCRMILDDKLNLLIISSNSFLLEQETFTELLWGMFHLIDEIRLRGAYAQMSREDRAHMEDDLAQILKLLLVNWTANVLYTRTYYPNYYSAALVRLFGPDAAKEQLNA